MIDLLQRAAQAPPAGARVHLDAALRAASDQLWVARNVARLYATHVGDRDAASRVLHALRPLTCTEWRLVAAAWYELGDRAAAARCLERAANNARVTADLCIVALGYRDAQFDDEAQLLLDGAARVAHSAMDAWTVANCYRDNGEPARARAVLAEALRDAVGVGELVRCAWAFAAHGLDPTECIARAAPSTVADWLELSEAHHALARDTALAERCVNAAVKLATSPQDERAIAVARGRLYLELLDDDRPKLPPSKLLRCGARSFMWDRDPNRLLGWLRARIPRTSMNRFANPAQFFVDDELVTLLELQKTGHLPHPLPPLATLRTYCWAEEDVDHLLRAFACTLVCVDAAAHSVEAQDDIEPLAPVLLESCLALGHDAVAGAAALFAALADRYEATRDAYRAHFAELALAMAASWLDPTDPRIAPLVTRLLAEGGGDLAVARDDRRHPLWRALARRTLVQSGLAPLVQRVCDPR